MLFTLGKWIESMWEWGMPISLVLAILDLLVNTCLSLCFGGYNALRVRTGYDRYIRQFKRDTV